MPREWTLFVASGDGDSYFQRTFRSSTLKFAAAGGVAVALSLVLFLGVVGFLGGSSTRTASLERSNALLSEELAGMRARVTELETEFASLSDQGSELRSLAGLEQIDSEVMQVGIGGPGVPRLEQNPLFDEDPVAAADAFAVTYDLNALERRTRLLQQSMLEAADSLNAHRELLAATPSILPAAGLLRSHFSRARLHPILGVERPHEGVDVTAPVGTPILAAADGRVMSAGRNAGYGLAVELEHGYGYSTLYAHASQVLVRAGQRVSRGDVIALVGNTGLSTAPHLHYEVRVGGRAVDPMNFILPDAAP